jgi:hypothetical protein
LSLFTKQTKIYDGGIFYKFGVFTILSFLGLSLAAYSQDLNKNDSDQFHISKQNHIFEVPPQGHLYAGILDTQAVLSFCVVAVQGVHQTHIAQSNTASNLSSTEKHQAQDIIWKVFPLMIAFGVWSTLVTGCWNTNPKIREETVTQQIPTALLGAAIGLLLFFVSLFVAATIDR